jgi:hypothetical protein
LLGLENKFQQKLMTPKEGFVLKLIPMFFNSVFMLLVFVAGKVNFEDLVSYQFKFRPHLI